MPVPPQEIRRLCSPRSFERGSLIAESGGNIASRKVSYDGPDAVLSAFVASSSGWSDTYRASVTLDEREGVVVDHACTCPAWREYAGMCKHCVALALAYNDEPVSFAGYKPPALRCQAETTRGLKDVVELFGARQRAKTSGKVDLLVELRCRFGSWSASFRLEGPGGTYVMKSIGEFVGLMQQGSYFSYGKSLAFVHIPESLTPRAQRIHRFLARQLSARAGAAFGAYGAQRGVSGSAGRSLELSTDAVVELLDALGNGSLALESEGVGLPARGEYRICDGDPDLQLEFYERDGGFALDLPASCLFLCSGESLYAIGPHAIWRCSGKLAAIAPLLTVLPAGETTLSLAPQDAPAFCAAVLPALEEAAVVRAPRSLDALRPVPCRLQFYFDRENDLVTCDAFAVYGERRFLLCGYREESDSSAETVAPARDEEAEGRALGLLRRFFEPANACLPLADERSLGELLFEGLPLMRQLGEVFTTPAFDRLIKDGTPRYSLGVSLVGNLIQLSVRSDDLSAAELAALLGSYRKRRRFHRLKSGAFVDVAALDLSQLERLSDDMGISQKALSAGVVELPSYRAFYLDDEADLDRDRSFAAYVERLRKTTEESFAPPPCTASALRPYQREGFAWLAARMEAGFGAVLADEMGLGKSVQLISLIAYRAQEHPGCGPALIVCPASLLYNWLAEFERFAPHLAVTVAHGSKPERLAALRSLQGPKAPDVLVTSYDSLRADADDYRRTEFGLCALDEAQHIKNPATLVARSCKRLSARCRVALTGTPLENRLSDLWSLFDFLMPGLLGPYAGFRTRFEEPIVGGDEHAAERLRAIVAPFICRRCKKDVLTELPDKWETAVYVPLEAEQRRLYDAHEQQLREMLTVQKNESASRSHRRGTAPLRADGTRQQPSRVKVLAELTRLRQLCCDPSLVYESYKGGSAKVDAIVELTASAVDGGQKVLVFSQFTSFLDILAHRFEADGLRYFAITGKTPAKRRLQLVDRFNKDDTPLFLVSLKAGGTGLNLTGASVVIHADPWWNAAAQNQATDRAHRIGQNREVSVVNVIAKGTVEERIAKLQQAKSQLTDQVVAVGAASLASLDADSWADLLDADIL